MRSPGQVMINFLSCSRNRAWNPQTSSSLAGERTPPLAAAVRDLPTLAGRSAASGLLLDPVRELSDLIENATAFCHEGADLSISVHHRRMIASAKLLSDLGQ